MAAFERARRKLNVRRPVRLLISQWIDSPVVVGIVLGVEEKRDGFEPGKIYGYPVRVFPCCVLIDKDGKVVAVGSLDDVLRSGR